MAIKLGSFVCNLDKRPFVHDANPRGPSAYPFPAALVARALATDDLLSSTAMRVFHALLYLAWNALDGKITSPPLAIGTSALRALASSGQMTNDDLDCGLDLLSTVPFHVSLRSQPNRKVVTTLLDRHYRHDGLVWWQFSDAVVDWCGRAGATYSWMDITVTRKILHPAGLRLYELVSPFAGRSESTIEASPTDLRHFLEVGDSYRGLSDLSDKVVKRMVEALNESKSLEVTWKLNKLVKSKHKKFSLTVAPGRAWTPDTQPVAQPIDLNDLAFLPCPFRDLDTEREIRDADHGFVEPDEDYEFHQLEGDYEQAA